MDPFEYSRTHTLSKMFDKGLEHQWHTDFLEKFGKKGEIVARWWPRDPNGKDISEDLPDGYTTPNSTNLWGATLLDFFFVAADLGGLPFAFEVEARGGVACFSRFSFFFSFFVFFPAFLSAAKLPLMVSICDSIRAMVPARGL